MPLTGPGPLSPQTTSMQAELPNPANFASFAQVVSEEEIAAVIPCGPRLEPIVQAIGQWVDAGFTELALLQIGPYQAEFCDFYAREFGPALTSLHARELISAA